jgi:signal transduction histidine kinase
VWLWEVNHADRLVPRAASNPGAASRSPDVDVYSTIERWRIPILPGSRWVGSRVWAQGPWVIAPVRSRAPAPPPDGAERRSRERITLELAGLCLGLGDRAGGREGASVPAALVHELGNPLAAARAALQLVMESLGKATDLPAARRLELLDELGLVNDDIDRAVESLRSLRTRLRPPPTE